MTILFFLSPFSFSLLPNHHFLQPTMMMMMRLIPRIYHATEARLLLLSTAPGIAAVVIGMSCFPADGISRCAHPTIVRAIALISIHLKWAWSFSLLIRSTRTNKALHSGKNDATTTTHSSIGANDVARKGHTILIAGGPTAG